MQNCPCLGAFLVREIREIFIEMIAIETIVEVRNIMKKILSIVLIFLLIAQQPVEAAKAKSAKKRQRTQQTAIVQTFPVPINKLANYKSLKKKMTDAEFKQAYNVALEIVKPIAEWSREEQIKGITCYWRNMVYEGKVAYTTDEPHYNDPYGYFVKGVASCAGCTRATGLCLNILGIPYEHINENKWDHQWCRIKVDDQYWISDAFVFYYGPEPAPRKHPKI